ncbi:MAG TPA: DUF1345 domain-containing protein [Acetobacteraceae bacterium]|nr:DUF1345 domain-containing protein [Acetobacteraceae bacterium]
MSTLRAITARPRLFASALIGAGIGFVLSGELHGLTRALLGWDSGCLAFLILSAHMFSVPRPGGIAADAERQEEGEWTIFWLTVGAVFMSFAAIIGEFSAAKDAHGAFRIGVVAATLFLSWLMTHTVFALRYAHEYYELTGPDGAVARGLDFPNDEVPDYWDFFYFSIVLGMTFQVSDVQITSRKLRRLAAAHGLLGFLFNTVILALSVNIGAGLL